MPALRTINNRVAFSQHGIVRHAAALENMRLAAMMLRGTSGCEHIAGTRFADNEQRLCDSLRRESGWVGVIPAGDCT